EPGVPSDGTEVERMYELEESDNATMRCRYSGCESTHTYRGIELPKFDLYWVCRDHMDRLAGVFAKLGSPGEGPSHMPHCTRHRGPVVAFREYEVAREHLIEVATNMSRVFGDQDQRAAIGWRTDCCYRPIFVMNIGGLIYSLNPT